jgi:hypothetical protein
LALTFVASMISVEITMKGSKNSWHDLKESNSGDRFELDAND